MPIEVKKICDKCGKKVKVQRIEFALGITWCKKCCLKYGITWRGKF